MTSVFHYLELRQKGLTKGDRFLKSCKTVDRLLDEEAATPLYNQPCEFSGEPRSTFLMDFSPNKSRVASTHGDHTVRVTDIQTGKCTHILTGHPRTPWCLAFHPTSDDILASGCLAGEVRIWDLLGGGSEVLQNPCGQCVITSLSFHPTEHILVFSTTNEIHFWDWSKPEPFATTRTANSFQRVRWVKFDRFGEYLFTGIANDHAILDDMGYYVNTRNEDLDMPQEDEDDADAEERRADQALNRMRYQRVLQRFMSLQQSRYRRDYPSSAGARSPVHEDNLEQARQYASHISSRSGTIDSSPRILTRPSNFENSLSSLQPLSLWDSGTPYASRTHTPSQVNPAVGASSGERAHWDGEHADSPRPPSWMDDHDDPSAFQRRWGRYQPSFFSRDSVSDAANSSVTNTLPHRNQTVGQSSQTADVSTATSNNNQSANTTASTITSQDNNNGNAEDSNNNSNNNNFNFGQGDYSGYQPRALEQIDRLRPFSRNDRPPCLSHPDRRRFIFSDRGDFSRRVRLLRSREERSRRDRAESNSSNEINSADHGDESSSPNRPIDDHVEIPRHRRYEGAFRILHDFDSLPRREQPEHESSSSAIADATFPYMFGEGEVATSNDSLEANEFEIVPVDQGREGSPGTEPREDGRIEQLEQQQENLRSFIQEYTTGAASSRNASSPIRSTIGSRGQTNQETQHQFPATGSLGRHFPEPSATVVRRDVFMGTRPQSSNLQRFAQETDSLRRPITHSEQRRIDSRQRAEARRVRRNRTIRFSDFDTPSSLNMPFLRRSYIRRNLTLPHFRPGSPSPLIHRRADRRHRLNVTDRTSQTLGVMSLPESLDQGTDVMDVTELLAQDRELIGRRLTPRLVSHEEDSDDSEEEMSTHRAVEEIEETHLPRNVEREGRNTEVVASSLEVELEDEEDEEVDVEVDVEEEEREDEEEEATTVVGAEVEVGFGSSTIEPFDHSEILRCDEVLTCDTLSTNVVQPDLRAGTQQNSDSRLSRPLFSTGRASNCMGSNDLNQHSIVPHLTDGGDSNVSTVGQTTPPHIMSVTSAACLLLSLNSTEQRPANTATKTVSSGQKGGQPNLGPKPFSSSSILRSETSSSTSIGQQQSSTSLIQGTGDFRRLGTESLSWSTANSVREGRQSTNSVVSVSSHSASRPIFVSSQSDSRPRTSLCIVSSSILDDNTSNNNRRLDSYPGTALSRSIHSALSAFCAVTSSAHNTSSQSAGSESSDMAIRRRRIDTMLRELDTYRQRRLCNDNAAAAGNTTATPSAPHRHEAWGGESASSVVRTANPASVQQGDGAATGSDGAGQPESITESVNLVRDVQQRLEQAVQQLRDVQSTVRRLSPALEALRSDDVTEYLEQRVSDLDRRISNLEHNYNSRLREIQHDYLMHRIQSNRERQRLLESSPFGRWARRSNEGRSSPSSRQPQRRQSRSRWINEPASFRSYVSSRVSRQSSRSLRGAQEDRPSNESHLMRCLQLDTSDLSAANSRVGTNLTSTSTQANPASASLPTVTIQGREDGQQNAGNNGNEDESHEDGTNWQNFRHIYLHPDYSHSILDDAVNRPSMLSQNLMNHTIAQAFLNRDDQAVANNIIPDTHRIQRWDLSKCLVPDIKDAEANVIVGHCKLHNDASCEISQDGTLLATIVPSLRGFPDSNILAVFSLKKGSLGQCLYTKKFGPNAISVSLSPKNRYVLVGLASKRVFYFPSMTVMVGQVFRLAKQKAGEDSLEHVTDVIHPNREPRVHVSVNSGRFLPGLGDGLVYGTTRGDMHFCRPGPRKIQDTEWSVATSPSHRRHVSPPWQRRRNVVRTDTSTQTTTCSIRCTVSTQTSEDGEVGTNGR